DAIQERLAWIAPWYRTVRRPSRREVEQELGRVFGPVPVPTAHTLIRELSEAQDLLLRIALALLERPRLVAVDDLDEVKDPSERRQVAEAIMRLVDHGITFVIGSADERDEDLFSAVEHDVLRLTR
ncbi:hypothetical protein JS562_54720, partial [Agrobacterium sp. S2]|nr:hypothetical protein [Agrobacterium sp. S2]